MVAARTSSSIPVHEAKHSTPGKQKKQTTTQSTSETTSEMFKRVTSLFDQPLHVACIEMNMDQTEFRALCKTLGIKRYSF